MLRQFACLGEILLLEGNQRLEIQQSQVVATQLARRRHLLICRVKLTVDDQQGNQLKSRLSLSRINCNSLFERGSGSLAIPAGESQCALKQ